MVKLSEVDPPSGMLTAPNDFAIVGGGKGVTEKRKVSISCTTSNNRKKSLRLCTP